MSEDHRPENQSEKRLDQMIGSLPVYRAPERDISEIGSATYVANRRVGLQRLIPRSSKHRWATVLGSAALWLFITLVGVGDKVPTVRLPGKLSIADLDAALIDPTTTRAGVEDPLLWIGAGLCADEISPEVEGAYLCVLDPESALAEAGVTAGAVLTGFNLKTVRTEDELLAHISDLRPGESVQVEVAVEDVMITVQVVAEMRTLNGYPFGFEWSPALLTHTNTPRPGEINPSEIFRTATQEEYDGDEVVGDRMPAGLEGVAVIAEVAAGRWESMRLLRHFPNPFVPGGLKLGDLVLTYNHEPTPTIVALLEAIGSTYGYETVEVKVQRGPTQVLLSIPLS